HRISLGLEHGNDAFRRKVLEKFPDDVIADDIYVAFKAAFSGSRVVYSNNAHAHELRASKSFRDLIKQKMRRSNAFLREIFRFIKALPHGNINWNTIYLTRSMQLVLLPFVIFFYVLLSARLAYLGESDLVLVSLVVLGFSLLLGRILLERVNPESGAVRGSIISAAKVFFIMNLIQFFSVIQYPFFRQTSSYEKIG
ncbi:MAG: hypothetical protein ABH834_03215, partial [Candidatus Altiarchaeota archaeon]